MAVPLIDGADGGIERGQAAQPPEGQLSDSGMAVSVRGAMKAKAAA